MKAGLTHPSLWSIVRWLAGVAEGDEAKGMRWHMEDDGCQRCNRLARSVAVRSLAEELRTGARTAEQVKVLADSAVGMLVPLPAEPGTFAPEEQAPYLVSQQRENGGLKVSVRDTTAGELAAMVSAVGQTMDGKKVWVELVGDKETLSAEVTLHSQGSAGCGGRATWPISQVLARLGMDCFALAIPEEDGWLLPLSDKLSEPHRPAFVTGRIHTAGTTFTDPWQLFDYPSKEREDRLRLDLSEALRAAQLDVDLTERFSAFFKDRIRRESRNLSLPEVLELFCREELNLAGLPASPPEGKWEPVVWTCAFRGVQRGWREGHPAHTLLDLAMQRRIASLGAFRDPAARE